jgi:vitamin B12 transporter
MNPKMLRPSTAVLLTLLIVYNVGCSDSPMDDQTATVEIQVLSAPDGEEFYSFDEPPALKHYETPDYPQLAKQNNLEGVVVLKLTIEADGTVSDVTVLDSSEPIFEAPAMDAAARCVFEPAKLDGELTISQVAVPYRFRLE